MRAPIKFKLNEQEIDIVLDFSRRVGLTVEDFCKQAVFYAINDAVRRTDEARRAQELNTNGSHDTASANSQGSLETGDTNSDSATLPDTEDAATQG